MSAFSELVGHNPTMSKITKASRDLSKAAMDEVDLMIDRGEVEEGEHADQLRKAARQHGHETTMEGIAANIAKRDGVSIQKAHAIAGKTDPAYKEAYTRFIRSRGA
ncbi:hypothetical protein BXY66_3865 [Shimia isoporae]|uniref:Uncharacterized protein n=1 Tax=Shimia isoporae TaxID=647720 RepID=A0A4R1N504_9RHOB|nr:hypothetical protein [Shimia isoporae]TCK99363.1 hypothetical protein BXY66_3865 [Shimia isoporae]